MEKAFCPKTVKTPNDLLMNNWCPYRYLFLEPSAKNLKSIQALKKYLLNSHTIFKNLNLEEQLKSKSMYQFQYPFQFTYLLIYFKGQPISRKPLKKWKEVMNQSFFVVFLYVSFGFFLFSKWSIFFYMYIIFKSIMFHYFQWSTQRKTLILFKLKKILYTYLFSRFHFSLFRISNFYHFFSTVQFFFSLSVSVCLCLCYACYSKEMQKSNWNLSLCVLTLVKKRSYIYFKFEIMENKIENFINFSNFYFTFE